MTDRRVTHYRSSVSGKPVKKARARRSKTVVSETATVSEIAGTPEPLPPPPTVNACPSCGNVKSICTLPEIAVWACGHWILKRPRSIAESFQDMLRIAYQAGAASASPGEAFEIWYQREVLK